MRHWKLMMLLAALATSSLAVGAPAGAPPAFDVDGGRAVPSDFKTSHWQILFDVATRQTVAEAEIVFSTWDDGLPMLDMESDPTSIELDGWQIPVSDFPRVAVPDQVTKVRVLKAAVTAGTEHRLTIRFSPPAADIGYSTGGVSFGFFMWDIGEVNEDPRYLHHYGPANLEFDQYRLTVDLKARHASTPLKVFANGDVKAQHDVEQNWRVEFPDYFTSSSMYLHITERPVFVAQGYYQGLNGAIPVTTYGDSRGQTQRGLAIALRTMRELETDYGAYAHDRMVAYITPRGGGMEYCGATITSVGALQHEITHSWFARGVMPANGNAGWLDEATATWRDNRYPRPSAVTLRDPVNLAGWSPYRRSTAGTSYGLGSQLLSEMDFLLGERGLPGFKSVLRRVYETFQRRVFTTEELETFLATETPLDVDSLFERYVYGRGEPVPDESRREALLREGLHPRPLNQDDVEAIR